MSNEQLAIAISSFFFGCALGCDDKDSSFIALAASIFWLVIFIVLETL